MKHLRAQDLKCTKDAQTWLILFNFFKLNWLIVYTFLYFVGLHISMSYYLTLFLTVRCEPLRNIPSIFEVISSWIFFALPTHLYIFWVDVSFENNETFTVWCYGSIPVETYSRNWIWLRSIFIIGSVWPWNWYCTHINLNNVILWGIIPICKIFAKIWHCLFCFGVRYNFWPFALTRECALHLRPCKKTPETYFAGGLAGFSKTICSVPE